MKLVQFWRNGRPALGLWTNQGILDVAAEATRKGCTVPDTMAAALSLGGEGLNRLLKPLLEDAQCFTNAPLAPVVTQPGRILCIGLNYRRHAKECNLPLPPAPVLFNKFPTLWPPMGTASPCQVITKSMIMRQNWSL